MESVDDAILRFMTPLPGSGSGSGSGYGSGYGDGSGSGYGSGYGDGSGSGSGSGSGYGSGSGSGYGSGSGSGSGSGDGDGSGSGSGYGSGYGDGSGDGDGEWKAINGKRIYYIDDTPTVIEHVHGDYAQGYIVGKDLQPRPVYIARKGNFWAHGETLRAAQTDAEAKWSENRPLEDRIAEFVAQHPDLDTPYGDLFQWHHILTGSCEAGRKEWCRVHGYQPTDSITVRTFIEQTRNDFGRDAIRELAKQYQIIS